MSAPIKPWESTTLHNNEQILKSSSLPNGMRSVPPIPPRPSTMSYQNSYNSYCSPYSTFGSSYGYGSMPYRSPLYGGYNSYGYGNSYGMYGNYAPTFGGMTGDESRFIQYAEESSRNTFANVESIVRAFNSMAMLLDNTFFAMTSSFRAVLSVAENFGRLRSMFGQIWHAINIFRLFMWAYRKMMSMLGLKVPENSKSMAWREAANGTIAEASGSGGSSWPTIAFFGILFSAPYFISKLLPKDKFNPEEWKAAGIPAKAIFDFIGTSNNELSFKTNDEILLAPRSIQEEMKLVNSGWLYAMHNGNCGLVPVNYVMSVNRVIPRKTQKRVSFGENQVYEAKDSNVVVAEEKNSSRAEIVSDVAQTSCDDSIEKAKELTPTIE